MERTHSGVYWRTVAAFASAGALLMLMGWAFIHDDRLLMYLGVLGLLGHMRTFAGMWRIETLKRFVYLLFGNTTTRVRVQRSGQASRSRSIQIHQ